MSRTAYWQLCLLAFTIAAAGCGGGGAAATASDSTKLMAKLGGESVDAVVIFKQVSGADAKEVDAALDKVMANGTTVNEKIAVCRATPHGLPAELHLAQPVEVGKVEDVFGPPGLKKRRNYPESMKELDFYTYGTLEVGMDGTKAIVVVVNK